MSPTAIIIDDESTLISYLSNKLNKLWPELEILGSAVNGRQGLALAAEVQPDIVFLDIQMPGLSGLQVAQAGNHRRATPRESRMTGCPGAFCRN